MSLLLALVVAQAGGWGTTFPPEATASHFPEHCEQLVIGPSTGWHGEAHAAALALFGALSRTPRCSMRMAEDFTDWMALLEARSAHEASDWLITVAVADEDLNTATITLYDERGAKVSEFRAVKGSPLDPGQQPVVLPPIEARPVHHELEVVPLSPQLTSAEINQHLGGNVSYHYRTPLRWLGVWTEVFFGYPQNVPTGMLRKGDVVSADVLMRIDGALSAGAEVIPFPWVFAPFAYAGGGAAFTSHYFGGSVTYLDTGARPMGELGFGVRWQSSLGFSARLGGRVMVAPAGTDRAYGCNAAEIARLEQLQAMHRSTSFGAIDVSPGCQAAHFDTAPGDLSISDAQVHATPSLLTVVMLDLSVGYAF